MQVPGLIRTASILSPSSAVEPRRLYGIGHSDLPVIGAFSPLRIHVPDDGIGQRKLQDIEFELCM